MNENHKIQLQTPIRVFAKGEMRETTLGRVFFNEILPADFAFDNGIQTKKQLKKVLNEIFMFKMTFQAVKRVGVFSSLKMSLSVVSSIFESLILVIQKQVERFYRTESRVFTQRGLFTIVNLEILKSKCIRVL